MNLGPGAPSPAQQRGAILTQLTQLYLASHDGITPRMMAGMELPPVDFMNAELEKQHATWRVSSTDGAQASTYELPRPSR
jgi:hypothetical protein